MKRQPVFLYVKLSLVQRAIRALEEQAQVQAGHSQGMESIDCTETQAWADAQELREAVLWRRKQMRRVRAMGKPS